MYTISQVQSGKKELLLRIPPIIIAYLSTHFFVEVIVERGLAPENFLLECLVFLTLWFVMDGLQSLILRNQAIIKILLQRQYLFSQFLSLAVSLGVATLFFKWHSFPLELIAFFVLWGAIDWGLGILKESRSLD